MRHFLSVTLVSAVLCLSPVICHAAQAEQQDNPYENTSIFVEAFVVDVQNSALAEAGVNPIGQSPEGVTPLKILWCLKDADKASVISGAKLTALNSGQAQCETSGTIYIRRENGQAKDGREASVSYAAYNSRQGFTVRPVIVDGQKVYCQYTYSLSGIETSEDKASPPDQMSYNWAGALTAPSGSPVIAGAMQDENVTTFLILTATIQNSNGIDQ